ncbi:MAG: hypothetical protein RSD64_03790, partial [Christensenellaceae bacterium]
MKKRFIIFFMVLTMIAVMMGGCKIQTPDEAAVQASQKSTAVQTVQPTVAAVSSPSASPSQAAAASDDSYDVSDIENQEKISDAEYQKYLNEANIRKADENAPKDQYGTNPVPDKMPAPVEWQDAVIDKNAVKTCTLYIECSTILNHMDQFDRDKMDVLPSDGIIYSAKE